MKRSPLVRALALSSSLGLATGVQAVTWDAGDWTLGLGGNVNAFYTHTSCSSGDLNSGGATLASLACPTDGDKNGINSGLLPSSLNFSAETTQNGFDISAHINVYYAITSTGAIDAWTGVFCVSPTPTADGPIRTILSWYLSGGMSPVMTSKNESTENAGRPSRSA